MNNTSIKVLSNYKSWQLGIGVLSFFCCYLIFALPTLAAPQCAEITENTVNYSINCVGPQTEIEGAVTCSGATQADSCCPGAGARIYNGKCIFPYDNLGTSGTPEDTLSAETLDSLNPLKLYSTGVEEDLSKPAGIINRVLRFAFPIAGLILFLMLVWSGFEILSGATEKKSLDAGKQRATAAVVGFILLFVSYWLAQIIEVIFGVTIL